MRKFLNISPKLMTYGAAALIAAGAAVPVFAQSNTDGTTNSDVTAKSTTGSSLTGSSSPGKGHHTKHMKHMKKSTSGMNSSKADMAPAVTNSGSTMGPTNKSNAASTNGG